MSAHTRMHHTEDKQIEIHYKGATYHLPFEVIEKYKVIEDQKKDKEHDVFAQINEKYTKAGALLKGIRAREGLTQTQLAKKLKMTQSDISQMEKGARKIGREVAKRIAGLFDVNYRLFLE